MWVGPYVCGLMMGGCGVVLGVWWVRAFVDWRWVGVSGVLIIYI